MHVQVKYHLFMTECFSNEEMKQFLEIGSRLIIPKPIWKIIIEYHKYDCDACERAWEFCFDHFQTDQILSNKVVRIVHNDAFICATQIGAKLFHIQGQDEFDTWSKKIDLETFAGGSAWADHVAIVVWKMMDNLVKQKDPENKNFLKPTLDLYLPCYIENDKFVNGDLNKDDCAYALNNYHGQFSKKIGQDTISQIKMAERLGAILHYCKGGFKKERNTMVAKSAQDLMIAYTYGQGTEPKDGGTKDTWDKSSARRKIHIALETLCKI